MSAAPNEEAIEAWNTVLFDKFVRFRHIVQGGLTMHGRAALDRHAPRPGSRALDLGCGFGDTTQELARRVGDGGLAVGIDAAPRFVETARRETEELGVRNARFVVADVQVDDLGGPYDFVFSRFGVMFFANPVQALRNVARSMTPGARLCLVVWRRREDNGFVHEAEKIARSIVPPPESHDAPTCGPGPFSMSSADVVSDQLVAAGFRTIAFERHDAPICIGTDVDDAIDFALALGPAGELLRLSGEESERRKPQLVAALRDVFSRLAREEGVFASSSAWIVTAERPS